MFYIFNYIGNHPLLLLLLYFYLKFDKKHVHLNSKLAKSFLYFCLGLAMIVKNYPYILGDTNITDEIIIEMYVAAMAYVECFDSYYDYREKKVIKAPFLNSYFLWVDNNLFCFLPKL